MNIMKMRLYLLVILTLLFGALTIAACTDTASLNPNINTGNGDEECDEGYEFNPQLDECVESENEDNSTFNTSQPDPSELEPWGDEVGDGIPNQYDNCPFHYNPDQTDTSGDGVGDVCDNCPHLANPDQAASPDNPVWPDRYDANGEPMLMGDACVPGNEYVDDVSDSSGDGVPDVMDNCPDHFNPPLTAGCSCPAGDPYCEACWCQCPDDQYPCDGCAQLDSSGDGVGDACDVCPDHYNPNQTTSPGNPTWPDRLDGNGNPIVMGDACSPEPGNIPICGTQDTEFELLEPNVYIMLDISGSMSWAVDGSTNPPAGQSRWELALDGLELMADDLHDEVRFGIGSFPAPGSSCSPGFAHLLNMGDHSAQALKNEFNALSPNGGTPMYIGLDDIHSGNLYNDPGDPLDAQRIKTILLVTDGEPNCDPYGDWGAGAVNNVVDKLTEIYSDGIPVFVLGFAHNTASLASYAEAGGTDEHFLADDAQSLADAMRDVADLLISCSYSLDPIPEDSNKIWISVDGDYLDPSQYSYDHSENVLTLNDAACDQVRSIDADMLQLEIKMGCASQCVAEQPQGLCDLYYETCGEPYPCDECSPEICDGQDNNCSGVIDDNCPECSIFEAPCQSSSDCCEPFICNEEGFCDHDCYPSGTTCLSNDRCCSGVCAIPSGSEVGSCIDG